MFLWKNAEFPDSGRVFHLRAGRSGAELSRDLPSATYLFFQNKLLSLAELAAYRSDLLTIESEGHVEALDAQRSTANFFSIYKITPVLGRMFTDDEMTAGATVALLSQKTWKMLFGSSAEVIGREFLIAGRKHTIIGVLPMLPAELDRAGIWVPLSFTPRDRSDYTYPQVRVTGRLADGIEASQLDAELNAQSATLAEQQPLQFKGWTVSSRSWRTEFSQPIRPYLIVLIATSVLTSVVAAINAASLLLARFLRQRSEYAVRYALGASTSGQLIQLTIECLLFGFLGAGLGLLLTAPCLEILIRFAPEFAFSSTKPAVGISAIVFAIGVAVFYGIALVVSPARQLRNLSLPGRLTGGSTSDLRTRTTLRILATIQLSIGFALVVIAGGLVQTWRQLLGVPLGFQSDHVGFTAIRSSPSARPLPTQQVSFASRVVENFASLPGIQQAAVATTLPLGRYLPFRYQVAGVTGTDFSKLPQAACYVVSPEYKSVMQLKLIAGRWFEAPEGENSRRVVVINATLARRHFTNAADAVGKWLHPGHGPADWRLVIGVVNDVRQEDLNGPQTAQIYEPFSQNPATTFAVVFREDPDRAAPSPAAFQSALARVDSTQSIGPIRQFNELRDRMVARQRFIAVVLLFAAGTATLIASLGFAAMMALVTVQRTREFGIMMALGAEPKTIATLVSKEVLLLALLGTLSGSAGAYVIGKMASSSMSGAHFFAPEFIGVAFVVLSVSVVAASAAPIWRAMRVDPVICLRAE